ncbi:MAG: acyl--CoA ligase [Gammaproteobacteria bacterium]|nr:acyl--CoA ligase [Gammaproteobacteria bacterium]
MTLDDLIKTGRDDSVAISAPDRRDLTYQGLRDLVTRTGNTLRQCGIGRGDCVAIVLPNGPVMATAFVAVASAATAAPLNPAYQTSEFEFYLSDLNVCALIVEAGSEVDAIAVAHAQQVPVIELRSEESAVAGDFELVLSGCDTSEPDHRTLTPASDDDIAMVLHTSGTTSRPKIVPLSHANICTSASSIHETLELTASDKCFNIMPLFHIHGLIGATLASLNAGASVYCTPGFNPLKFFALLEEAAPTWYTGVPTMHQAILARADRNQAIIEKSVLRFIRSSSASLAPQVMAALEETFDVPVIESYGMTEAAHQMASNPLPPGKRKPGSVGVSAGPEIAIMNEANDLLEVGALGEIVIRGDNVTPGYLNNPSANEENFSNGWFRTGDQGVLDEEGYLTITGRLKEIINRGGEKISPREVDDVLMDHPAVQQVVTFAVPHAKLGEDVAAAIVLREGERATVKEIRAFASERLARFKVPRTVLFLDEIPKGATGKLQRIGLAQKLGLS